MRRPAFLAAAAIALAVAVACDDAKDGAEDTSGKTKTPATSPPNRTLGQACSDDAQCVDGACALGVCRHDCHDWAECVLESGSRVSTCVFREGMDPEADYRPGFCTLSEEWSCDGNADCPDGTMCDPNGQCRAACGVDAECLLGPNPYCGNGGCYDGNDRGYKVLEVGDQTVTSPLGTVRATVDASVLAQPQYCAIFHLDPAVFDPAVMGWPHGQVGFQLQCNPVEGGVGFTSGSDAGPVTFEFEIADDVQYSALMGPQDISLCGGSGCTPDFTHDAGTGWTSAVVTHGAFNWVMPWVVDWVDADIDGTRLNCAGSPKTDQAPSAFAFKNLDPTFLAHPCWPGVFEFRVDTPGSGGPHDLANPASWSEVEVSATIDGVLYGVRQGAGTSAGASGTVHVVGGQDGTARLTDVVLTSLDAPGSIVTIRAGLLVNGN